MKETRMNWLSNHRSTERPSTWAKDLRLRKSKELKSSLRD
jgi:hypothetical protein